jgi:hypothetical protein
MLELGGILALVAGILLLFYGRRLFWLAAALIAFLFSWQFLSNFSDPNTLILVVSVVAGVVFAWLAIKFVRIAAYVIGFLAGAVSFYFLADLFGLEINFLLLVLIGGVVGLVLILAAFDWGLILLTAWAGASAVMIGLRDLLNFEDITFGTVLLTALMILGIGWQASRKRAG